LQTLQNVEVTGVNMPEQELFLQVISGESEMDNIIEEYEAFLD